jgi:hypothetical protein
MTFTQTRATTSLLAAALLCTATHADIITLDSFTNPLESETFVTGVHGNTITGLDYRSGLEVGWLDLAGGLSIGDRAPRSTKRASESQNQAGLAGVLGGQRLATLEASPLSNTQVSAVVEGGSLRFKSESRTRGVLELAYSPTGGLNADLLSAAGAGRFEIELLSANMYDTRRGWRNRSVPIEIELVSGAGTAGETVATASRSLLDPQLYTFGLAEFAGVDFSDIDSITLRIDQSDRGLADVEFALGPLRAYIESGLVPEPIALVLLASGVLVISRNRNWSVSD